MKTRYLLLPGVCCILSTALASDSPSYSYATRGVLDNVQTPGGTVWKLVVNESNLGGKELDVAEVTLPANSAGPSHAHGALEVIYVLEGTYDHEVNGKLFRLKPGMVGIVRPGDKVRHIVPKEGPAKLLILWVPGGVDGRGFKDAKGTKPEPVPELKQ